MRVGNRGQNETLSDKFFGTCLCLSNHRFRGIGRDLLSVGSEDCLSAQSHWNFVF